jgi:hypothetical protein
MIEVIETCENECNTYTNCEAIHEKKRRKEEGEGDGEGEVGEREDGKRMLL